MKILENLWLGKIHPWDQESTSPERIKLLENATEDENKLLAVLSDEAKVLFEKHSVSQNELITFDQCDAFIRGFKLATMIMAEVMNKDDTPLLDMVKGKLS